MFMPMVLMGPNKTLNVSGSVDDYNVFVAAGSPSGPVRVAVKIAAGAEIGSTSISTAAFILGSGWHSGAKIKVYNNVTISGKGGSGGTGEGASVCTPIAGVNATAGGPALDASGLPTTGMLDFYNNGTIAGGGGGGGYGGGGCVPPSSFSWGGGGGGSGRGKTTTAGGPGGAASGSGINLPGSAGTSGTSAAAGTGGNGGNQGSSDDRGGNGGDFGGAGTSGLTNGSPYGAGGAAGNATLGDSKINFVVTGTIIGTRSG